MWLIATSRNAILVILGGLIGYYFAADGSEPPFKIIGNFVNFHFFSVFCSFFLFICTLPCVYMLIIFSVFIYWYEFECFTKTYWKTISWWGRTFVLLSVQKNVRGWCDNIDFKIQRSHLREHVETLNSINHDLFNESTYAIWKRFSSSKTQYILIKSKSMRNLILDRLKKILWGLIKGTYLESHKLLTGANRRTVGAQGGCSNGVKL